MSKSRIAAPVVAAIAVLGALIATAVTAAAPIYTGWSAPVNVGAPVNTPGNVQGPALSADGLSLYFVPGFSTATVFGLNDIYVSQRASLSSAWGAPVNLGSTINSAANDFVPAFTPDGHWMFFASDRLDGFGLADIYESYRPDVHDDLGWQAPVNLGAGVNSNADDNGVGYFDNGGRPQLFFGSGRLGGAARDLFLSNLKEDGTWGAATVIAELSSPSTENRPTVRQDGLEIFFYSDRPGGVGSSDIWTATRPSVDSPWSTPINLGPTVNTAAADVHPYLSVDGNTLTYSSAGPGGLGGSDLYMITRSQILPTTKNDCKGGGFERFGIFKNQGDCVSYVATQGGNQPG